MEILSLTNSENLSKSLSQNSSGLTILYFYVEDSGECKQMSDVVSEFTSDVNYKGILLIKVEAAKFIDIVKEYNVSNVPAFIFINNENIIDTLVGANVPLLSKKLDENFKKVQESEEDLDTRLKKLTNKAPIMLFMKGNPSTPRCGFSKQVIALLGSHNAKYETFDILEDYEVREGLKKFSNWPTYPQLYVKGELIGGLDILRELSETGELKDILAV